MTQLLWLQRFVVDDRFDELGGALVCWETSWNGPSGANANYPATVMVYLDPDGNGDPSDAIKVAQGSTTTLPGEDVFHFVPLPHVVIGPVGTSYFIGIYIDYPGPGAGPYLAIADNNFPHRFGTSWFVVNSAGYPANPADVPTLEGFTLVTIETYSPWEAGNWAIRAVGVPGVGCLMGLPADLNADGAVDGADLGLLLGAWGAASGDLNGDATTDGADLGIMLGAWTG